MMTRKDFKIIAEEIHFSDDTHLNTLCKAFIKINPRFDKDRFLKACGVEE